MIEADEEITEGEEDSNVITEIEDKGKYFKNLMYLLIP